MAKDSISFTIDEEVIREAEVLFNELELSIEEALNIFIKQSIKEKGIPFKISMEVPK